MVCEDCQNVESSLIFTQIVEQEKKVFHLCKDCAEKRRASIGTASEIPITIPNLDRKDGASLLCKECNTSFDEFQRTGRFGCASCYEAFEPELEVILKRIHGVSWHQPVETESSEPESSEVDTLEARLQTAVAKEAFEEAARIRDLITRRKPGSAG